MTERIYRAVLICCPRDFRERFGPEMIATAREMDRSGSRTGLLTSARALVDAITVAVQLRAEDRAARRLANATYDRNRIHDDRETPVQSFMRDIHYAIRGLTRERAFSLFVVGTLALGIGANAAMFGIADRLLLRGPEHVRDADRVVRFYQTVEPKGMNSFTGPYFGHVTYDLLRKHAQSFSDVGVYFVNEAIVGRGMDARTIDVGYATETFFPLLGVTPQLGRFIDANDNAEDAAQRVVVLGYNMWQSEFGGRSDVVGRSVILNNATYTVIGVVPRGFTGAELQPVDMWAPASLRGPTTTREWKTSWNAQWLLIVGRLKPGVTFESAGREATAIVQRNYTGDDESVRNGTMKVAPLSANESGIASMESRVLAWLGGVTMLVLLIACANVANLMLARGVKRTREIAIRAALGAGRRRLISLLLIESLLLAAAGAVAGLAIAYVLGDAARRVLFEAVEWTSSPINIRVIGASTLLAVLTGIIIGLTPALRASRTELSNALKAGVREGGGRRSRLRGTLTVAQATLSVLLLIGAGLFVRSLWNVRTLDIGLDASRLLLVRFAHTPLRDFPEGAPREAEQLRRNNLGQQIVDRFESISGVEDAALSVGLPFSYRFSQTTRVPGRDSMPKLATGGPSLSAVSTDYFTTVGTSIVEGRAFNSADRSGSEPVAIVNERMAKTVWPGESAIGKCILVGSDTDAPCHRIVGIAEDTRRGRLREDPTMHFYLPFGQERGIGGTQIVLRARGNPAALEADVRKLLIDADPTIMFVRTQTLQSIIDPQMRPWKIGAVVFALSGVLALIVAAIGVYSVMSYLIADRRHEIGVRLALGAVSGDIIRMVLRGSFLIALLGVAIGQGAALALGRFVQPILFEVSPKDPLTFAAVGATLVLVALVATLIPAWRTRTVNPVEALRAD